eukprot:4095241-Amphidinium_carterae.1
MLPFQCFGNLGNGYQILASSVTPEANDGWHFVSADRAEEAPWCFRQPTLRPRQNFIKQENYAFDQRTYNYATSKFGTEYAVLYLARLVRALSPLLGAILRTKSFETENLLGEAREGYKAVRVTLPAVDAHPGTGLAAASPQVVAAIWSES